MNTKGFKTYYEIQKSFIDKRKLIELNQDLNRVKYNFSVFNEEEFLLKEKNFSNMSSFEIEEFYCNKLNTIKNIKNNKNK
jgi:hypothetical protein